MHVYLDHAASTPIKPAVREAMLPYLTEPALLANPSSNHVPGRAAALALAQLRAQVAAHFQCAPGEVVFNSGGSEGDTQALLGTAWRLGRPLTLAISTIEHEAVLVAAQRLEAQGHSVVRLPVTRDGVVDLNEAEHVIREQRPDLVSVMAVNNEVGTVQPVLELAALCERHGCVMHCDAVRAVGHGLGRLLTDPRVHLLNFTAHKFGGPRGVGALIMRGARLPQLICGGGQEHGVRAGTENLAGIAGLAKALELADAVEAERVEQLRRELEQELVSRFPGCEIHGKRAPRATYITSVSFMPRSGYKLQAALDARGFAVGTGSACHDEAEGFVTISPVLRAMGVEELLARGTLRLSLGWNTTRAELVSFLDGLEELVAGDDGALNCVV
jgi:cysteine desulfurase